MHIMFMSDPIISDRSLDRELTETLLDKLALFSSKHPKLAHVRSWVNAREFKVADLIAAAQAIIGALEEAEEAEEAEVEAKAAKNEEDEEADEEEEEEEECVRLLCEKLFRDGDDRSAVHKMLQNEVAAYMPVFRGGAQRGTTTRAAWIHT